jgi:hypothetical protein
MVSRCSWLACLLFSSSYIATEDAFQMFLVGISFLYLFLKFFNTSLKVGSQIFRLKFKFILKKPRVVLVLYWMWQQNATHHVSNTERLPNNVPKMAAGGAVIHQSAKPTRLFLSCIREKRTCPCLHHTRRYQQHQQIIDPSRANIQVTLVGYGNNLYDDSIILWIRHYSFKRRIKSHLAIAGIIRSSPYFPH